MTSQDGTLIFETKFLSRFLRRSKKILTLVFISFTLNMNEVVDDT